MSYGFEVYNTNGSKLIISEKYQAYHHVGDASYVSTRLWRLSTGYPDCYILPFVVMNSGMYCTIEAVQQRTDLGSGIWDIHVRPSSGNDGHVSRVLCFSVLPTSVGQAPAYSAAGLNNYGLQVFAANGAIAFDSTRKPLYLRAVQDMSGFDTTANAAAFELTIPSLETPAIFSASTGVLRVTEYEGFQDVYREKLLVSRVNGTKIQHAITVVNATVLRTHIEEQVPYSEIQEDIVLNSVVSVIDAAKYIYS